MTVTDPATQRARAARVVAAVIRDNRTIDWVIANRPDWLSDAFSAELAYGTLRHFYVLSARCDRQLKKPLRKKDQDLYALLLVGAYQLLILETPHHAAINETVSAVGRLRKPWARAMLNGVLRNIARAAADESEHAEINEADQSFGLAPDKGPAHHGINSFLFEALSQDYPQVVQDLATACLSRAAMWLRINTRQTTTDQYIKQLNQLQIGCDQPFPELLPETVRLHKPTAVTKLPGFVEGLVSVQDVGAQLAVLCHPPMPHSSYILDACAAPGGKLFHLLERSQAAHQVVAMDNSEHRLQQTQQQAKRLHHEAAFCLADASHPLTQTTPFDLILLDAPCSGTGTMRRHPDLQLLLTPAAIEQHVNHEQALLANLWQHLAVGGYLLYSTCSLLQRENDGVINRFVADHANAQCQSLHLPLGTATATGWQTTPLEECDGFFYCLLHKTG